MYFNTCRFRQNPDHSDPSNWTTSSNIGGSPGQADGEGFNGNLEVDQDGDGLNAGGISYQIQLSGDLSTWSEASEEFTILSSQDNGDGTESAIYR